MPTAFSCSLCLHRVCVSGCVTQINRHVFKNSLSESAFESINGFWRTHRWYIVLKFKTAFICGLRYAKQGSIAVSYNLLFILTFMSTFFVISLRLQYFFKCRVMLSVYLFLYKVVIRHNKFSPYSCQVWSWKKVDEEIVAICQRLMKRRVLGIKR